MKVNLWMLLLIIFTYVLGAIIWYLCNKKRIGDKGYDWTEVGPIEYTVDKTDILMESYFWPIYLCILIVLLPCIFINWICKKL